MLDVLLLVTTLGVCGGIGLPVTELLPSRFAGRALVAPVLGLAALAVVAPVTYRWGVSPRTLLIASAAAALAGIAWWARRIARRGITGAEWRLAAVLVGGWLIALLVMMLPRWVGGEQFSVFQGNIWDAFGYLESAVVYARRSYAAIISAGDAALIRDPLMPMAQTTLGDRPSVDLLYAAFSRIAPDQAYRLYYPFLVACLSQCVLVGTFIARAVLPAARPALWLAVAAVFPLGFWGQYVFDINAWSQIASSPIQFLMFSLVLRAAVAPLPCGDGVRLAAALALVAAGAVCLYPEATMIYLAALGSTGVAVPAIRMLRARRVALAPLAPLLGFAGVAAIALYPPTLQFAIRQVTLGTATKAPWWTYFQAFFYGRDAAPGDLADSIAGFFGLYFATPTAGTPAAIGTVERVAVVATVAGLIAALAVTRARELGDEARALVIAWSAIVAVMLVPAAVFLYQGNYWPAGKAVAFASPLFMTLLAIPVAVRPAHPARRPLRWLAIAFVAFQLGLGAVRIAAVRGPSGVNYAAPYPSTAQIKQSYGWDLSGLDAQLKADQTVLVRGMDPWPEAYLMMYLYTHRVWFAKATPVNTYFGVRRDIGTMRMIAPDVEISIEPAALVLHYRDGRPDLRVRSRPE